MKPSLAIVDYGMGNLRSVAQALKRAAPQADVVVANNAASIRAADRIVLPGQGAMPDCMASLEALELADAVREASRSKPLLGVCVGEQMLFDWTEEGGTRGLGLLPGQVVRFRLEDRKQEDGSRFKVPQMGWNRVRQVSQHPLWEGIADNEFFYFVHSYYVVPARSIDITGKTIYGALFTSAVAHANIFATQFHPEKSADAGLRLFCNFTRWNP